MRASSQSFSDEVGRYLSASRKCRSSARRGTVLVLEDAGHQMTEFLDGLGSDDGFQFDVARVATESDVLKVLREKDVKAVVLHVSKVDCSRNGSFLPLVIDEKFPDVPLWVVGKEQPRLPERVGFIPLDEPVSFHDVLGKSQNCRSVSV